MKFTTKLCLAWLGLIVITALIGPWVLPLEGPDTSPGGLLAPAGGDHLLGTDEEGRDVLQLLVAGARTALIVGLATVVISGLIGTILGTAAGYMGGFVDRIVMTMTEAVYSFPGILLAIFLMFLMPEPGVGHVVIALCIGGWATYARLARGIAMSLRERPFIEAARCIGLPNRTIMFRHVMPQTIPHIAIQASFGIANAIMAEATLSFLGLGIADGTSWGHMLSSGAVLYLSSPHLALAPGVILALTILVVLRLADNTQQYLNPKATK
ncbi:MAG: ABC transporter permease [Myxococcales bacterium]|mgnify:CR=1 FL=1|nr:ABC transporter permease [Myxococcales bacterium]